MSVLVTSIILLTLAPIVTKRVDDNINLTSIKTRGALFTINKADPTTCNITADDGTADPENCSLTLPNDVTSINAIVLGNGGNGSNAFSDENETKIIKEITTSQNITIHPTEEYNGKIYLVKDLKIEYMVSGGAGGGKGWGGKPEKGEPQSQEDCNEAAGQSRDISNSQAITKFIPASMNGADSKNICVTKYNAGDTLGSPIPSSVTRTGTSSSATKCEADSCCWGGETYDGSNGGTQRTAGTNSASCSDATTTWGSYSTTYSSCNRTVCTFQAAQKICSAYSPTVWTAGKWRLPTHVELLAWATVVSSETSSGTPETAIARYIGDNGIQLCDSNSAGYGSLFCGSYTDGCPGADGSDDCRPSSIWTTYQGSSGYRFYLHNGVFYSYSDYPRKAFSARCVYDPPGTIANSGAGGGAGAAYSNHMIKSGLLNEDITLTITIGKGGTEGTCGEDTTVKLDSGTIIAYGARGDFYGESGSQDGPGIASKNSRAIKMLTGRWTFIPKSSVQGTDGQSKALSTSATASGGQGGNSSYLYYLNSGGSSSTYSGGGAGGSLSNPDGQDGQQPGAGGGGGTAIIDEDTEEVIIGNGGNGADGAVILSYTLVPIPTPGSGGSGAGMVVGRNIQVNPENDKISVSFEPTTMNINNFTLQATSGTNAIGTTPGLNPQNQEGGQITNPSNRLGTFEIKKGQDGEEGKQIEGTNFFHGGTGGASATGAKGACGGLNTYKDTINNLTYTNSEDCILNIPTGINLNGSDGTFNVLQHQVVANSFGIAGTGGGGGGFGVNALNNPTQGQGGRGSDGYVYVWWVKE